MIAERWILRPKNSRDPSPSSARRDAEERPRRVENTREGQSLVINLAWRARARNSPRNPASGFVRFITRRVTRNMFQCGAEEAGEITRCAVNTRDAAPPRARGRMSVPRRGRVFYTRVLHKVLFRSQFSADALRE